MSIGRAPVGGFSAPDDPPPSPRSPESPAPQQAPEAPLPEAPLPEALVSECDPRPALDAPDLSIVIPTLNEQDNIGPLVTALRATLGRAALVAEILVVDGGSRDATRVRAEAAGAMVFAQTTPGYGGALRAAFARARGRWVITLDSDLSHPPEVVPQLFAARGAGDIVIASRYVPGGVAIMPHTRRWLSVFLNRVFAWRLGVCVRDLSSGYRLYPRAMLERVPTRQQDFSVLIELLVGALAAGFTVAEVPFRYAPRASGSSKARIIRFGVSYARLFLRLRRAPRPGSSSPAPPASR